MAERSFTPSGSDRAPITIDSTVAHTSRVDDYLLGGTDNPPPDPTLPPCAASACRPIDNSGVDREVAEHAFAAYPGGHRRRPRRCPGQPSVPRRCVRYLAGAAGIRQFLDVGIGIPSAGNVHTVAQATSPDVRVVYVDNDPIVLAHALLVGTAEGSTAFVEGDLRMPGAIVDKAAETLDLSRPVALMLIGLLHVIPDEDEPHRIAGELLDALPAGSYLALSHMTDDFQPDLMRVVHERLDRSMHRTNPPAFRSRAHIVGFFDGLEPVESGVVHLDQWRPDESTPTTNGHGRISPIYCGVGRKA